MKYVVLFIFYSLPLLATVSVEPDAHQYEHTGLQLYWSAMKGKKLRFIL